MFLFDKINAGIDARISAGAQSAMSELRFFETEIARWRNSSERLAQIQGHLYYVGEQDILFRKRTVIGERGELTEVRNLPNNRTVDNVYKKLVQQKANYLLGQPFLVDCPNRDYTEALKSVFNKRFMRTFKNAGKAALNGGIAWLYPFYDGRGELRFRFFPAYEILPYWKDGEHTELDCAIRVYSVESYEGSSPAVVHKAELFRASGVERYVLTDAGKLVPDYDEHGAYKLPYVTAADGTPLCWPKIPLVAVRYSETELPLLKQVKTLQDGLNLMLSDFTNAMQEDARNTILVLKNYDGANLGEFRKNLATYGAVKVRTDSDGGGGVETLEIDVNADSYKTIIEIFKKAIIENGMSYDARDERLSGNPNQMNIQSMYSDIDLDCNDWETELQAMFEELMPFVNVYLANSGRGEFFGERFSIIFNRDILISENDAIENCVKSLGVISKETIVGMHPWIDDKEQELRRIANEG